MTGKSLPKKAENKLQRLLADLQEAKDEEAAWAERRVTLQAQVLEVMDDKTVIFTGEAGDSYQATRVQGEGVVTDAEALRKKLTAAQWAMVTDRVLNTKKLEAAMLTGQIKEEVVAAATSVHPRKAYVLITKRGSRRRK